MSGFRAERTSAKKISFYFTPSTTGKFAFSVLEKEASAPTDLGIQYDMAHVIEYTIGNTKSDAAATDVFVVYLQIENAAGVKSQIYSLEVRHIHRRRMLKRQALANNRQAQPMCKTRRPSICWCSQTARMAAAYPTSGTAIRQIAQ